MQKYSYFIIAITINTMLLIKPVNAETHVITQDQKKFSDIFLKMENNDTIKFVNLDTVKHRLVFTHKGHQRQLHAIDPGKAQELTLPDSGIYDIQCRHHPEMKLTVFIPYVAKVTKNMSNYEF